MPGKGNPIDVMYVAKLARLELNEADRAALQRDMESIVDYIDELSEVDVSGVRPMFHAVEVVNVARPDVSRPGYGRDRMLANAPGIIEENLIKVPQVLPGEGMN